MNIKGILMPRKNLMIKKVDRLFKQALEGNQK